jgi:hypothetical protein
MPFSRTEPNVPEWEEAGSSPIVLDDGTDVSQSLSSDFTAMRILFAEPTGPVRGREFKLQLNGDTNSNYDIRNPAGTRVTNRTNFVLGFAGVLIGSHLDLKVGAEGSNNKVIRARLAHPDPNVANTNQLNLGEKGSVSQSVISSLRFFTSATLGTSLEAHVYGWTP